MTTNPNSTTLDDHQNLITTTEFFSLIIINQLMFSEYVTNVYWPQKLPRDYPNGLKSHLGRLILKQLQMTTKILPPNHYIILI